MPRWPSLRWHAGVWNQPHRHRSHQAARPDLTDRGRHHHRQRRNGHRMAGAERDAVSHAGPPMRLLGQDVVFATAINNSGRIESKSMTVTSPIPDGLRISPAPNRRPPCLTASNWYGRSAHCRRDRRTRFKRSSRLLRPGPVTAAFPGDREKAKRTRRCVTTQVTTASLRVTLNAPPTGMVGVPVTYQIAVNNPNTMCRSPTRL